MLLPLLRLLMAAVAFAAPALPPSPEFTEALALVSVPPSAAREAVLSPGLLARCGDLLMGTARARAAARLDRYAAMLIASYPAGLRPRLEALYFRREGVMLSDDVRGEHEAWGMYDILKGSEDVIIDRDVMERTRLYSRIMLIHEGLVHRAQHLQVLAVRPPEGDTPFIQAFIRQSELVAYLVERDLARLVPLHLLEEDVAPLGLDPLAKKLLLGFWGRLRRGASDEEFLDWIYNLAIGPTAPAFWPEVLTPTLERHGLRPRGEMAAVLRRWNP